MTQPTRVFGPHCHHDECSWAACDAEPDERKAVVFSCRHQAECALCGPASVDWRRLATQWRLWAVDTYGTDQADTLMLKGAPANVIATAELVAEHPVADRVEIRRPDDETVEVQVNGVVVGEANLDEHRRAGVDAVEALARRIAAALGVPVSATEWPGVAP